MTPCAAFLANYDLLLEYVAEHGRIPPSKETYKDVLLGKWVQRQRTAQRAGSLTEDTILFLERVPGWGWSPKAGRQVNRDGWRETYDHLLAWLADTEGRFCSFDEDRVLYDWVRLQRGMYPSYTTSEDEHLAERARLLAQVPGFLDESKGVLLTAGQRKRENERQSGRQVTLAA